MLMTGCDQRPVLCYTDNNIRVFGCVDASCTDYSCGRLSKIENEIRPFFPNEFNNLKGYGIWLYNSESFQDYWGRSVGGYTQCESKEMVIGIGRTVYAHELIHAMQKCSAPLPIDEGSDRDHSNWLRDSYYQIIEEVSP